MSVLKKYTLGTRTMLLAELFYTNLQDIATIIIIRIKNIKY